MTKQAATFLLPVAMKWISSLAGCLTYSGGVMSKDVHVH